MSTIQTETETISIAVSKEVMDALRAAMAVDCRKQTVDEFLTHWIPSSMVSWIECVAPHLYKREKLGRFR